MADLHQMPQDLANLCGLGDDQYEGVQGMKILEQASIAC